MTVGCTLLVFSGSLAVSSLTQVYDSPPTFPGGGLSVLSHYIADDPAEPDEEPGGLAAATASPAYEFRGPFDITNATVERSRIVDTDEEYDATPALGAPGGPAVRILDGRDAISLRPEHRVVGIVVNEQARAYPIRILNWHGVVNDNLGGEPIAVTWCGLSALARVFERSVQGETLAFGNSGRLLDCNRLLYDHQTMSLWSQALGQAVSGAFAHTPLVAVAAVQTSWDNWLKRHPDTTVLAAQTGYRRNYHVDPYKSRQFNYHTSANLLYPASQYSRQPDSLHPKALTLGVTINGDSKAYPFCELAKSPRAFRDTVGGTKVIIRFDRRTQTARATDIIGLPIEAPVSFWYSWANFHPKGRVYNADHPLGEPADAP